MSVGMLGVIVGFSGTVLALNVMLKEVNERAAS